jgi:hypothetical protein
MFGASYISVFFILISPLTKKLAAIYLQLRGNHTKYNLDDQNKFLKNTERHPQSIIKGYMIPSL